MPLIPAPFLFRCTPRVPRIDLLPRTRAPLLALPEECRVPLMSELEGSQPFTELRVAWNPEGLAISVTVKGTKRPPTAHPDLPDNSDGVRLWIDTRDTRNIHRASRFCHLFQLFPLGGGPRGTDPIARQLPVARAGEDAPEIDTERLLLEGEVSKTGWRIDVWFPKETLNGFDPVGLGRIGFYCHVRERQLGHDYYSVGEDFPFSADPSLWSSLELISGGE